MNKENESKNKQREQMTEKTEIWNQYEEQAECVKEILASLEKHKMSICDIDSIIDDVKKYAEQTAVNVTEYRDRVLNGNAVSSNPFRVKLESFDKEFDDEKFQTALRQYMEHPANIHLSGQA